MPQNNDPYASLAKPSQPSQGDDPYASLAIPANSVTQTSPTTFQGPKIIPPYSMKSLAQGAGNFGIGALKGAGSTANNIGHALFPDALVKKVGLTPPSEEQQQGYFAPKETMQSLGKGVEQTAEFMLPGGAEEALAAKGAELAPKLAPVARIGAQALSSGLINKAQGGSFTTGALTGGGAGAASEGLRAAAPVLAEKAIGIRGKFDRSFNKEPGRALLDETTGINPEKVSQQAKNTVNKLSNHNEILASVNPTPISLTPARQALTDASNKAVTQNAKRTYQQLQDMGDTLRTNFHTGQPIPPDVPVPDALHLRQGFDQEHLGWNPDMKDPAMAAGRKAYRQLTDAVHNASPGIAANDARISNLLPVAKRAHLTALSDNTGAKIIGRIAAPAGSSLLGGYEGYRTAGPEGALIGGLTGAVVPSLLSSPQGQLLAARTFNRPGILTRPLTGAILNIPRPSTGKEE